MDDKRTPDRDRINLNEMQIKGMERLAGLSSQPEKVTVYFGNLIDPLVARIQQARFVMGCVAWLTNEPILKALAQRECSIIVQKEDFLRPDDPTVTGSQYRQKLHQLYSKLRCHVQPNMISIDRLAGSWNEAHNGFYCAACEALPDEQKCPHCELRDWLMLVLLGTFGGVYAGPESWTPLDDLPPIRCLGNRRIGKAQAEALMHHKFLVFTDQWLRPVAVWTGSFNMTHNATRSLENAVLIEDPFIAAAYTAEFLFLSPFSERLNWQQEWTSIEGERFDT